MGSHQSANAVTTTWLTPPDILAALGSFDLDPCAAPEPRPWPTATVHWTRTDNPLNRAWLGRVWLNPPFSPRPTIEAFLGRLAEHGCGIALLFARTETDLFFRLVWERASSVLFLRGRPHFHHPDGRKARANSGCPIVLASYGEADAATLRECGLAGQWFALTNAALQGSANEA
jgi:hypothetical protein